MPFWTAHHLAARTDINPTVATFKDVEVRDERGACNRDFCIPVKCPCQPLVIVFKVGQFSAAFAAGLAFGTAFGFGCTGFNLAVSVVITVDELSGMVRALSPLVALLFP